MSVVIYGELHHRRLLFLYVLLSYFHTADFHFIANQDLVQAQAKVDVQHTGLR